MMKISFIVPVYNCIDYLEACVGSIMAVPLNDSEILLIDDGSTDGSGALCDKLARKYPKIRVIHQANGGVSSARNQGIREASGEYLLFVDSDDTLESDMIVDLAAKMHKSGADAAIFGISFDFYRGKNCYRSSVMAYPFDGCMEKNIWGAAFENLFVHNSLSSSCTKILKKEILQREDLLFSEDMFLYEDLEFFLRYLSKCDTILLDSRPIYRYRQSEDEGNAGRRLKRIDSIPELLKPIEEALEKLPETVSKTDRAKVLQQLHLVLAREKIAVSDIKTIQAICRDYRKWAENRQLPMEEDSFQTLLLEGKAKQLWLRNKKTQLRHWIAVRVKAFIRGIKNGN